MNSFNILPQSPSNQYICLSDFNLYDSSDCQELATQAQKGRILTFISSEIVDNAIKIRLCEDDYEAWLPVDKIKEVQPTTNKYQAISISRLEIEKKLDQIIEFTQKAKLQPNVYLWGGTVAPDYDCSGLMQTAFASVGIWLPRDSYQQEAFTQRISKEELQRGDLIFFGQEKVNHVALYLGENNYIHSSGKAMGNNGIAINKLSNEDNQVSTNYYQQLRSFGRVMSNYLPQNYTANG